jgi:hypothetical protein
LRFKALLSKIEKPQYNFSNTLHIPKGIIYNYSKGDVKEHLQNTNEKIKLLFTMW